VEIEEAISQTRKSVTAGLNESRKLSIVDVCTRWDSLDNPLLEFDHSDLLPRDCYYIFCLDDDAGALEPMGVDYGSRRLICVSKIDGEILVDQTVYID